MFPQIFYDVQILPGDKRPKFSFTLQVNIRKGELEWRPRVPTVCMVGIQDIPKDQLQKRFAVGKVKIFSPAEAFFVRRVLVIGERMYNLLIMPDYLVIPLPGCIYTHPMKKEGCDIRAVILFRGGYMSPYEGDINSLDIAIEGYLPWRRREKPDYTDFLEAFSVVPKLLEQLWHDSLDIGASEELVYKYQGRPELLPWEEKTGETKTSPVVFI